ncbi:dolichyl-phosphate beta-glucosyltransferase [Ophiostoma piceae UAMH 11346]|uniref:dolichyl-phosphate beta-glucosyltransferase n=1 Tax=Ophiostoma piceae (strain UAMH 11346) TaxID=1262450 RepID=S3C8L1_OPHP1|nr:dolichyl-phosphate beta-glucosyltransferase [Ophiostoma piceae UAMH 11346]
MDALDHVGTLFAALAAVPILYLLLGISVLLVTGVGAVYVLLCYIAPKPRLSFASEKTYQTSDPSSKTGFATRQLPCWYDKWLAERHLADTSKNTKSDDDNVYDLSAIEPAEVGLTVVVPAYNEALRILPALQEMVDFCDKRFGRPKPAAMLSPTSRKTTPTRMATPRRQKAPAAAVLYDFPADKKQLPDDRDLPSGYEILIVNDASSDNTVEVALDFAKDRGLHDVIRVITLDKNRGKGGGVTHGFRHARGAYVVLADADGASRFSDLDKLLEGCDLIVDVSDRGVAIGSRAHLVGSEEVVQRSALRNFLMKSFHFVLTILTPPATSRIRDTQCGFKLFSRAALPHIVPYMHTEGWIFDIEMLMLAESAPATPVVAHDGTVIGTSAGIKVAEVPVGWHEVDGSKMNLVQDSIRMAIGLTVLRASWMLGVYRRRLT